MELATLLANGKLVSPQACSEMLEIMRRQQYLDQVPRYLAYNPFMKELEQPQDFTVASKTGFFPGTRVDAGVITTPAGKIAYCAMAMESKDLSMAMENEAAVVNGVLGRMVVEHWWPEGKARDAFIASPYYDSLSG